MTRPIRAEIHLAALRHNLAVARRHAPNSKVMAVIKANAYGHGLLRVARALRDADGFAVLELDAAVALRAAGFQQPILLLEGFFEPSELQTIARYRLTPALHCIEQIELLLAQRFTAPLDVYLKINTGMNRLGVAPQRVGELVQRLRASGQVTGITLMTHFARSDERDGVAEQLQRFQACSADLALPRSLANSAAVLWHASTHAEWVRPGIMLYGATPFADVSASELGLRPAMQLHSRVIAVHDLKPGEAIGYSATYVAETPTRVGVVACGYADGYPRRASTGTKVIVDMTLTQTLGRVSMDMLYVDLTHLPNAGVGSEVTLWGTQVSVDEVASAAGTIGYEVLSRLAPRVPVIEIDG